MAWGVYDYPEPKDSEDQPPICPVCGNECYEVYRNVYNEIVGCEECVTTHDAWETEECRE